MKIGVIVGLTENIEKEIAHVAELGLESCQINSWNREMQTPEMAARCRKALDENGITCSTVWIGWSGPAKWNFIEGPTTLGLVPEEYRQIRTEELIHGVKFAHEMGVDQIASHMGFLPEVPSDPQYAPTVAAIARVAQAAKELNMKVLFETGQETPITILRVIEEIGTGNLGVNLDPANLLLYGKANPVDSLKILGPYVYDVHAKDGEYPTEGRFLGEEKALGQGSVNFPKLVEGLKQYGYDGSLTIEREISGEEQLKDIIMARDILRSLI